MLRLSRSAPAGPRQTRGAALPGAVRLGACPASRGSSRWRFLISPKWLGWHALVILSVLGMLWLGNWQLHRAEAGNALSWAYTFEWPLFAIFAMVFWAKTIRDEFHPPAQAEAEGRRRAPGRHTRPPPGAPRAPGGDEEPGEDDEELAAYNAYLARLTEEVEGPRPVARPQVSEMPPMSKRRRAGRCG